MSIYLDHNATTPLDPEVLEAMLPYQREFFGNPSSRHRFGRVARAAVEQAREQVAEWVGAHPSQVVFTSGGTEANNLAIQGIAASHTQGSLLVGATEHPSVMNTFLALARRGREVTILQVDGYGQVNADVLDREGHRPASAPVLVSVMLANNETGVVQDISPVVAWAHEKGAIVHTDAVQAAGKIAVDFGTCGVHLMSLSAHKIYGPKGVGALITDKSVELEPILFGGSHEKGRRAGTENVAAIVGFGVAASLASRRCSEYGARVSRLRQRLESALREMDDIEIIAENARRLPNTVCFAARGVDGETLLMGLDRAGMAVSSGSACASGSTDPSPVLLAMGVDKDLARGAIRVSLGYGNKAPEIDQFVQTLSAQLQRLRNMSNRAVG